MTSKELRPNVIQSLAEFDTNPKYQPITDPPYRSVSGIQFGVLSPEEIEAISVCRVFVSRVAQDPSDSVYDEKMGPSNSRGICLTCKEDLRVCPGHFGRIDLAVPIVHPMFVKFIVAILNCVCLKCSKLKLDSAEIELEVDVLEHDRFIKYIDRLKIVAKKCSDVPYCKDCNHPHPEIREEEGVIYRSYQSVGKRSSKRRSPIEVEELRNILAKISNEDVQIMGFQQQERKILRYGKFEDTLYTFRPEWLILTKLPVLPPLSRPPENEGEMRSDDDLTTSYTDIIKYNNKLREKDLKEKTKQEVSICLYRHIRGLFDNNDGKIKRTSGKVAKGIKDRISGKNGHIRGKLMGKRVDCSARTVITADISLRLNELGVPEQIAKTLSFPERVTSRNIKEINELFEAGKLNMIIRGKKTYLLNTFNRQLALKIKPRIDDLAYRHLRDNDTVVFNRQPTLHRGSMMAHQVRVLPGKTFRLNLSVTTPYNAD